MELTRIAFNQVSFGYPGGKVISRQFSLDIRPQTITCLLGPSGCGKTTLLNLTAGLIKPDSGSLDGINNQLISYIFQETRILPWKTVLGNVTFVLKDLMPKAEAKQTAEAFLKLMHLEDESHNYPKHLSGGMKQRVAIARAFAYPSSVILMDEAFKGLDLPLKKHIFQNFKEIWESNKRTVIFVTHDMDEALELAHEVIVLKGPPLEVSFKTPVDHTDLRTIRESITSALYQ